MSNIVKEKFEKRSTRIIGFRKSGLGMRLGGKIGKLGKMSEKRFSKLMKNLVCATIEFIVVCPCYRF